MGFSPAQVEHAFHALGQLDDDRRIANFLLDNPTFAADC